MRTEEKYWLKWQDEMRDEGRKEFQRQLLNLLEKELKTVDEIDNEWDQGFDKAIQLVIAIIEKGVD